MQKKHRKWTRRSIEGIIGNGHIKRGKEGRKERRKE
jgi:hypothetical protein